MQDKYLDNIRLHSTRYTGAAVHYAVDKEAAGGAGKLIVCTLSKHNNPVYQVLLKQDVLDLIEHLKGVAAELKFHN